MERDRKLSGLIRESGLVGAPEGFTGEVMKKISAEPVKTTYKPLIGRAGRIVIILSVLAIVVLSLVFSEPGGRILEQGGVLSGIEFQMPELNFSLQFLSDFHIPTGILAGVLALFILILSDAGLSRRRLT